MKNHTLSHTNTPPTHPTLRLLLTSNSTLHIRPILRCCKSLRCHPHAWRGRGLRQVDTSQQRRGVYRGSNRQSLLGGCTCLSEGEKRRGREEIVSISYFPFLLSITHTLTHTREHAHTLSLYSHTSAPPTKQHRSDRLDHLSH